MYLQLKSLKNKYINCGVHSRQICTAGRSNWISESTCRPSLLKLSTVVDALWASSECGAKKSNGWIINLNILPDRTWKSCASLRGVQSFWEFGGCTSSTVWPTGSLWLRKTTNKMYNPAGCSTSTDYWEKQHHYFRSWFDLSKERSSEFPPSKNSHENKING